MWLQNVRFRKSLLFHHNKHIHSRRAFALPAARKNDVISWRGKNKAVIFNEGKSTFPKQSETSCRCLAWPLWHTTSFSQHEKFIQSLHIFLTVFFFFFPFSRGPRTPSKKKFPLQRQCNIKGQYEPRGGGDSYGMLTGKSSLFSSKFIGCQSSTLQPKFLRAHEKQRRELCSGCVTAFEL